jgi:phenylacetate-CoA ligase
VNGRRDATISVMGANIYPEDVESVVYRLPQLARLLHSFMLSVIDDGAGTPRPHVALELTDLDGIDDAWRERVAGEMRDGLLALNIDSVAEFPAALLPIVGTYGRGEGPFAGDAARIKQRRVAVPASG